MQCPGCEGVNGIVALTASVSESSPDQMLPLEEWEEMISKLKVFWCPCGALWTPDKWIPEDDLVWLPRDYKRIRLP